MSVKFQELPLWDFDVAEISAGVYRVTGSDRSGHRVVTEGMDPDECLDECQQAAIKIEADRIDRGRN